MRSYALLVLCFALAAATNKWGLITNPKTIDFPAGLYQDPVSLAAVAYTAALPSTVSTFKSGGANGLNITASSINVIQLTNNNGGLISCGAASGCPHVLSPQTPIPVSHLNGKKAISLYIMPDETVTFRFPTSLAFGFNSSASVVNSTTAQAVTITASAFLNGVAAGLPGADTLESVGHGYGSPNGYMYPVLFSAPGPFTTPFNEIRLSHGASSPVWLTISDVFWGETGYFCVGYEDSNQCVLQVNLEELPFNQISMDIINGTSNVGQLDYCSVQGFKNMSCAYPFVADKIVLACVPLSNIPQVRIQEHGAEYNSVGVHNQNFLGQPDCDVSDDESPPTPFHENQEHYCFLDPRARLEIPVQCWPEVDVKEYGRLEVGGVDISKAEYTTRVLLWQTPASYTDGLAFYDNAGTIAFRVIDPTKLPGGFTPQFSVVVLAIPNVTISTSLVVTTDTANPDGPMLNAFSTSTYDCTKSSHYNPTTGLSDPTAIIDIGTCQAPFDSGTPTDYLAKELQVRAKCSDAAMPEMELGVTLFVQAPTLVSPQYRFTYTRDGRGNVDTSVCVIAAGTYFLTATEDTASTDPMSANCEPSSASICNGTPLDVVSIIEAEGCCRGASCVGKDAAYPTAGGDAVTGFYEVTLWYKNQIFRTLTDVDPNEGVSVCVLNLKYVTMQMVVDADTGVDVTTTLSADFDCTWNALSNINYDPNVLHSGVGDTPGYCARRINAAAGIDIDTKFPLFGVLFLDLDSLQNINFGINLVTPDGTGLLYSHPGTQSAFCDVSSSAGELFKVCVPAVGSPEVTERCNDCPSNLRSVTKRPLAIQVIAEDCGENLGIYCLPGSKRNASSLSKRDEPGCISSIKTLDCSVQDASGCASCMAAFGTELCLWDTLYLPMYDESAHGVIVELWGDTIDAVGAKPVRTSADNQGGMPRCYPVLDGQLHVRVIDNPASLPVPIGGPATAPWIVSDLIDCSRANKCHYNQFVGVLDVSGDATVGAQTVGPESGEVLCNGITYLDSYSYGDDRQPLQKAEVTTAVNGYTFRPLTRVASSCEDESDTCQPEKYIVLRTSELAGFSYDTTYHWAGLSNEATGIRCDDQECSPLPCQVRWAPVDPICPELYSDLDLSPLGNVDLEDDDNLSNFRFHDLRYAGYPSGLNLAVNGVPLCMEYFEYNPFSSPLQTPACRVEPSECKRYNAGNVGDFPLETGPYGRGPVTESSCEPFVRYFALGTSETIPVEISMGCASVEYNLTCAADVTATGYKNYVDPYDGEILPGNPCEEPHTNYWHRCEWQAPFASLIGLPQYWPAFVKNDGTCAPSNDKPAAYQAWAPLRPFALTDIDLTVLTNGTCPEGLSRHAHGEAWASQDDYCGDDYSDDESEQSRHMNQGDRRRNPFDLTICCGECPVQKRSLLNEQRSSFSEGSCGWDRKCDGPEPISCLNPYRIEKVGGYHNLICALAGTRYSYTVEELFRLEDPEEFGPKPEVCPEELAQCLWEKRVRDARPKTCFAPADVTWGALQYEGEWTNEGSVAPADNGVSYIHTGDTASFTFKCADCVADSATTNVLLRPNFEAATGYTGHFLKAYGQYAAWCNDRNDRCVSQNFICRGAQCAPKPVTLGWIPGSARAESNQSRARFTVAEQLARVDAEESK